MRTRDEIYVEAYGNAHDHPRLNFPDRLLLLSVIELLLDIRDIFEGKQGEEDESNRKTRNS